MFLLIDNYDSFTYNLVQAFSQIGMPPHVIKNDDPQLVSLSQSPDLKMVCISPGPSNPQNAGFCLEFMEKLPKTIPCLGVCLGHQILGHFAGVDVVVGQEPVHGKSSLITHTETGLFAGLSSPMTVGRYHSLVVLADQNPKLLEVLARTDEGDVMALRFRDRPWVGVQFHPESILTPDGLRLLQNFPTELFETQKAPPPPLPTQISTIIETLAQGKNLTKYEAKEAFTRLLEGELTPSQASAFLLGLRIKGETSTEVGEAVQAVLAKAVPVPALTTKCIDVVGTGGDGKRSFNCSTATSLTLAGMGYKVLKHGNRSASSSSGSADVLEKLGIPLDIKPSEISTLLEKQNFVFLFAPHYHPAFRHVAGVRREMGIRTLFNILGPLVNPAHPTHVMLGVANRNQLNLVAETFAQTNPEAQGVVVLGARNYDELTVFGEAEIVFIKDGTVRPSIINPKQFGFAPCEEQDLIVENPSESAKILKDLLSGGGPKAMQDMLILNVGMAVYIMDHLENDSYQQKTINTTGYDASLMAVSMEKARDAIQNGAGIKPLHKNI